MKPHPHAAIIHAFADGAQIQFHEGANWRDTDKPMFDVNKQYRIKPVREYPETKLSNESLELACDVGIGSFHPSQVNFEKNGRAVHDGFRSVANAALRDAIDRQQVVTTDVVEKLARELAEQLARFERATSDLSPSADWIDCTARDIFRKALAGAL